MKNCISILGLLFSCLVSCRQQSTSKHESEKAKPQAQVILTDSSILENAKLSPLDFFIRKYADSINNLSITNVNPAFLANAQFDYNNAGIWSPSHHPLPLRYMIMAKVVNCKSLSVIINDNNSQYKLIPVKEHQIDVDHINLSFYDLALIRYKELKCQP